MLNSALQLITAGLGWVRLHLCWPSGQAPISDVHMGSQTFLGQGPQWNRMNYKVPLATQITVTTIV